jgi:hypothetical protein
MEAKLLLLGPSRGPSAITRVRRFLLLTLPILSSANS